MLNFCTLFDSHYLSRGLVTYESLMSTTDNDAHLYVFAFDDRCYTVLNALNLPHLTVISLAEFEDEALLAVKSTRTRAEYCWTCTSSTIAYCIEKYNLQHCIYIDADMVFYQNPRVLLAEMPVSANVLITEHRYTPQYDKAKLSGLYCVQFMYFDNTENGKKILHWWRDRCLEWCFNRHEDGKFGDQKYLDDWTTRFTGVHVLHHLGGGIAPWNVQRFDFQQVEHIIIGHIKNIKGLEGHYTEGDNFEAVFYHFHGVKTYLNGATIYAPKMYMLKSNIRELFYTPYIAKLAKAQDTLRAYDPDFDTLGLLNSTQFSEDKRKGWFAFFKTNYVNRFVKK